MENIVLYDWLSITSKIHSPQDIVTLLGMESVSWSITKGAHGYRSRYYFNCISIHFDGREDMGVWLEMSGQGCRCFEDIGHGDYDFLLKLALDNPDQMKITRLDVAYDDHSGVLDLDEIIRDTLHENFVAKANVWEVIQGSKGNSVVIGSRQSAVLIRIYDKARERNIKDGSHWIRVELQMRDDRCKEFVKLPFGVGESFVGVLLNYLRYVVPDEDDTNKWRWPLTDYWANLVSDSSGISIYTKPGMEYNVLRCEDYVFNHAGNAISALLQIHDIETFLQKLNERKCRPNPKYTNMIEQHKAIVGNYELL